MKKTIYVNDNGERRSIYPIDIPAAIEDGFRPEGDCSPALPPARSDSADSPAPVAAADLPADKGDASAAPVADGGSKKGKK